mmetsp:Transcript_28576/g.32660  ORF Transcript_28576/g.32660 Transcript_28576/m.32660 type:complete len:169 (+) Transcript_28576:123-629(+)
MEAKLCVDGTEAYWITDGAKTLIDEKNKSSSYRFYLLGEDCYKHKTMSKKDKQTVKDAESKCSTCSTEDGYFSCVSPCTQSWWYKQVKSINLSQECITSTLISSVGYLLIGITMLNKVPQIIKIYKNKSAEGLLLSMFYIDLFMGINMVLYYRHLGLGFNLYGEICML